MKTQGAWLGLAMVLALALAGPAQAQLTPDPVPADTSKPKAQVFRKEGVPSHLGRPRVGHFVHFEAGGGLPGGELANRFGAHLYGSAGYDLLLPSKWVLGIEGGYGFGRAVNGDPLSTLRDANGDIIAKDGSQGVVEVTESLWNLPTVKFGRMFVLRERKKFDQWEQALLAQVGYTWLQYKYRLNVVTNDIAQLEGDRQKGYDRLSSGPGGTLELTYLLENPKGGYGLFLKGQYAYAATQSRRVYDYNLGRPTTGTLGASMLNLQIGLVLTFFSLDERDYFYY